MNPSEPLDQPQFPLSVNEQASRSLRGDGPKRRSNRTPDQIARKRDQDREAQRVSRERNRRRIEEAETRIERLEATVETQEQSLKRVIGERDAALTKISELSQQLQDAHAQLTSIRHRRGPLPAIIGPDLGLSSSGLPKHEPHRFERASNISTLQPEPGPSPKATWKSEIRVPQNPDDQRREFTAINLDSPAATQITDQSLSPGTSVCSSHVYRRVQHSAATTPMTDRGSCQPTSPDVQTHQSLTPSSELWTHRVKNSPPLCLYDQIILLCTTDMRKALDRGEPPELVMGTLTMSNLPSLKALPSLRAMGIDPQPGRVQPISQILTDILATGGDSFRGVAEQVAMFWLLHLHLRVKTH